jgi:hypothetical protein
MQLETSETWPYVDITNLLMISSICPFRTWTITLMLKLPRTKAGYYFLILFIGCFLVERINPMMSLHVQSNLE